MSINMQAPAEHQSYSVRQDPSSGSSPSQSDSEPQSTLKFDKLPPELLIRITQWLDATDLFSLALTNRLLCAISEQWLYRSISMNAGQSSKENATRLARLCQTLGMNRRKAELVRALEIKDLSNRILLETTHCTITHQEIPLLTTLHALFSSLPNLNALRLSYAASSPKIPIHPGPGAPSTSTPTQTHSTAPTPAHPLLHPLLHAAPTAQTPIIEALLEQPELTPPLLLSFYAPSLRIFALHARHLSPLDFFRCLARHRKTLTDVVLNMSMPLTARTLAFGTLGEAVELERRMMRTGHHRAWGMQAGSNSESGSDSDSDSDSDTSPALDVDEDEDPIGPYISTGLSLPSLTRLGVPSFCFSPGWVDSRTLAALKVVSVDWWNGGFGHWGIGGAGSRRGVAGAGAEGAGGGGGGGGGPGSGAVGKAMRWGALEEIESVVRALRGSGSHGDGVHLEVGEGGSVRTMVCHRAGWNNDLVAYLAGEMNEGMQVLVVWNYFGGVGGLRKARSKASKDITNCITSSLRHYRSLRRFAYGNAGASRTTLPLNVKEDGEVVRGWGEACPSLSSCVLYNHTWIRVAGQDWKPVVALSPPNPPPQISKQPTPSSSRPESSAPQVQLQLDPLLQHQHEHPHQLQHQHQPPRTPQPQHQ